MKSPKETNLNTFWSNVRDLVLLTLLLFPLAAVAQEPGTIGRDPGAPAGSYNLDDNDNVNLFNLNLNYRLTLLNDKGRGELPINLGVVIEQQWNYEEARDPYNPDYLSQNYISRVPNPHSFVGHVRLDITRADTGEPCDENTNHWWEYRVRMVYVNADGTEETLRDGVLHSTPKNICVAGVTSLNLGNTFESDSGSFIKFVTDSNIHIRCEVVSGCTNNLSGNLYFPNGVKSRVEADNGSIWGYITSMTDRNGNKVAYNYSTEAYFSLFRKVTKVTDSNGREINIAYDVDEGSPYGVCTKIIYKGFGGETRVIRISEDTQPVIRNTQSYDNYSGEIFHDDPNDNIYAPTVSGDNWPYVNAVWLPDGRSYQFKYNVMGKLARVDLPTGGAIEYDYAEFSSLPYHFGEGAYGPTNYISEKRVYDSGNALVRKLVFSTPGSYTSGVFIPSTRAGTVRDVDIYNGSGTRINKSRHYFYGVTGVANAYQVNTAPWWVGKEVRTEIFDSNGTTMLRINENEWRQRWPSWCNNSIFFNFCGSSSSNSEPANNTFLAETRTTLSDGNLVSKVTGINPSNGNLEFDAFNNQTDAWFYDYGSGTAGSFLKRTHTDFVTDTNYTGSSGPYLLHLPTQTWVSSDANGSNKVSLTQLEYDNYTNDSTHVALVSRSAVSGHNTASYDAGNTIRGNVTAVKSYANAAASSGAVTAYSQYDILGNLVKTIDENGNTSTAGYSDNFGSPDGNATTNSTPSQISGLNTYAFTTSSTNPLGWTTYSQYDYHTGDEVDEQDANGVVDSTFYDDPLDRETKQIDANNFTNFRRQTRTIYDDANRRTEVRSDSLTFGDELQKSESYYDGLGRTIEDRDYESDGGYIRVKTEYDSLDRVKRSTNPYRPLAGETEKWKVTRYDSMGRVSEAENPDGGIVKMTYAGNETIVTDQAMRSRKSRFDALGRLRKILEDPVLPNDQNPQNRLNYETTYDYNALDNLTAATQATQTRNFAYDSLSRLLTAANPESGTVSFTYDANSNLLTKTDARGVTATHVYDALNRPLSKTYTDGVTPNAAYTYDDINITNSRGKLTKLETTASIDRYTSFDVTGRILSSQQETAGKVYDFAYTYDLSGNLKTETYPSTRVVKFDHDSDGDLLKVYGRTSTNAADRTYASNFNYGAHGKLQSVRLGNGKFETTQFNSTLQPTQIGLGSSLTDTGLWKLAYNYGTTDNNGNIKSQTVTVPTIGQTQGFTAVQTYTYDALNRMQAADEKPLNYTQNDCNQNPTKCWKQTFTYDRFGNRRFDLNQTTFPSLAGNVEKVINPKINTFVQNNRFDVDQDNDGISDYVYDASGNLTKDAEGKTYAYNGENKQREVKDASNQPIATYEYDGDGSRVKKRIPATGEETIYVYDAGGRLAEEFTINITPTSNPGINYLTADALGSPRAITDGFGNIKARRDFMPFGEEIQPGIGNRTTGQKYASDNITEKFTGKKRDSESGFDYFEARYYASKWGRFTTSDEFVGGPEELTEFDGMLGHNPTFYAELAEPQSLNKYQYCLNNPLRYVDPDGHQTAPADWIWSIPKSIPIPRVHPVVWITEAALIILSTNGGPNATSDDAPAAGRYIERERARLDREHVSSQTVGDGIRSSVRGVQAQLLNAARSKPPKPTGKTSSGRPTDSKGRPLGPSGKVMQHNTRPPTRKQALDKGKNQKGAAGVVIDRKNKFKGKRVDTHVHSVDKKGNRIEKNKEHIYLPKRNQPPKNPPPGSKKED